MSKKDGEWEVPESEALDLDDDFSDLDEAQEQVPEVKNEGKPVGVSASDLERMVEKQGQAYAENYLYRKALEDPEFAALLRKEVQPKEENRAVAVTPPSVPPKKEEKPNISEEKISQLEKMVQSLLEKDSRRSQEQEWEGAFQSAQRLVSGDQIFADLSPESRQELVGTFVMAYKSNEGNKNVSIKEAYERWRQTPLRLRNDILKDYIAKKKAVKSMPVTIDEAISSVSKEQKDFKVDAAAMESGKVTDFVKSLLKKGFGGR